MILCESESEGVEVSTICRIISDIFLCVFRSHRSFRFGARSEGLRQKQGFDRKYLATGREDFQPNRQA